MSFDIELLIKENDQLLEELKANIQQLKRDRLEAERELRLIIRGEVRNC